MTCNLFENEIPCTHWKICHFIITNIEEKDKKTKDDDGFTALDLATKSNFKPIMDLLSENKSGKTKVAGTKKAPKKMHEEKIK